MKRQVYNSCVLPAMTHGAKHGHSPPEQKQASSRTNKDGKEYVKHHIPARKTNIWVRHKTKDGHCVETLRQETTSRKVDYWKGPLWQRIAQARQVWKQHAQAFVQPRDTGCTMMMVMMKIFEYDANVYDYPLRVKHKIAFISTHQK